MHTADGRSLFTDLYELTMMQGYLEAGHTPTATFSLFCRELPPDRGYVVAAGLQQAVDYLRTVSFGDDELSYLASAGVSEPLLRYLDGFEFTGSLRAVPEGTVVFPDEPLLEVTAPLPEAQLFETLLLNQVGFGSLIATKAARMRDTVDRLGDGQSLVEFGSRRAHGVDAGLVGPRAAYVGGVDGTSNVAAGRAFDLPTFGTMAHSWVQSFESERAAFEAFLDVYGEESVLLVDTYDTVAGARTAVAVAEERGVDIDGVRLDSGDLVALSRAVADVVDGAGVFVSGGVDEYRIERFLEDGGVATGFGPGTALSTGGDVASLDAVYKLVEVGGEPTMKLSTGKVTYPGAKSVRRVERDNGFRRDVLGHRSETDPEADLLVEVMADGALVADLPDLEASRERRAEQVGSLPEGCRALREPAAYPVEVSDELDRATEALRAELSERYGG